MNCTLRNIRHSRVVCGLAGLLAGLALLRLWIVEAIPMESIVLVPFALALLMGIAKSGTA
jgi:hypothetical protein